MFIGPCIIAIVDEWKTNLVSLATLFHLLCAQLVSDINPWAPELFFLILAQPVYKMWIIQEPNKLALLKKLHFEEKKRKV